MHSTTVRLIWIAVLLSATVAVAVAAESARPQLASPSATTDSIVAAVGDRVITRGDLELHWRSHEPESFVKLRQEEYDAAKGALDKMVDDYLIQNEARRQSLTVDALLVKVVAERKQTITDQQIAEFYETSGAGRQGFTLEQTRPMIQAYLERQRPDEVRAKLAAELRKAAGSSVAIRLSVPRESIQVKSSDPTLGEPNAALDIVEFSDFQCPYCKQAAPVIRQVMAKYEGRARLTWKNFPLPAHPDAQPAAQAALCARDQGKFWSYHDILFASQDALRPADLKRYAAEAHLDVGLFEACVAAGSHKKDMLSDMDDGRRHGVTATPTVFINGRMLMGALPLQAYEKVIAEELQTSTTMQTPSGQGGR